MRVSSVVSRALCWATECVVTDFVYALLCEFCAFVRSIICRINICVYSVEINLYFLFTSPIFYNITKQ